MRITESRLKQIIKNIIKEEYDPDEYMMPGSYGALEDEEMSIEEMEKYLESHSYEIERADGYKEVMEAKGKFELGFINIEEYKAELRGFIGDIIDIYGKSSF